jgi:hypothetical protein
MDMLCGSIRPKLQPTFLAGGKRKAEDKSGGACLVASSGASGNYPAFKLKLSSSKPRCEGLFLSSSFLSLPSNIMAAEKVATGLLASPRIQKPRQSRARGLRTSTGWYARPTVHYQSAASSTNGAH